MKLWSSLLIVITLALLLSIQTVLMLSEKSLSLKYNLGNFISQNTKLVFESQNESLTKNSIYFLGDIMLARDVERRLASRGIKSAFSNFNFNTDDTYVVANFEAAIPEKHIKTPDFHFNFSVPTTSIPDLKKIGITHLSLANNHAFDFGEKGYLNTIATLQNEELVTFGHPKIISTSSVTYLDINQTKVALIGLLAMDNFLSENSLKQVFDEAISNSDLQIVFVHWGNEYVQKQSNLQRNQAKVFSNLGADIVIGHHPHVVQGIEWVDDTLVFYSLGNFIFDQYFSKNVQEGLVLKMFFDEGIKITLIPVSSLHEPVTPKPLEDYSKEVFLKELSKLSQPNLGGQIQSGEIIFKQNLASFREVVIMTP